jgi:hypothetical protein
METLQVEGNVENSNLLEQVSEEYPFVYQCFTFRSLDRGVPRDRSVLTNGKLVSQSQDILQEMQAPPDLWAPSLSRTPRPPLEPSGLSDTDEENDELDSEGSPEMK